MVRARRARARDRARAPPSPRGRRTAGAGRVGRALLPARPRLDARRDATEARHVRDHLRARLDGARRVGVGHVEGHEAAETGIPNDADCRVAIEALGDRGGGLALARRPDLERLEPAKEQPGGVGRGDGARARAELERAERRLRSSLQTAAPRSASSWPARYFVAECTAMSQPSSSGRTCRAWRPSSRTRHGRVRGRRLEVRHRQERVRRRLEPDEIDAVGRRPGLVVLDLLDAPAPQLVEHHAGAVVRASRARRPDPARGARARRTCTRPRPRRRAAPRRGRARRDVAPPPPSSGCRSANR